MKATDLMIGDFVRYDDKVCRVCSIEGVMLLLAFKDVEKMVVEDKIEPIPLTAEILEKNGWRFDDLCSEWYIPIGLTLFGRLPRLSVFDGVEICYVHELQHAHKLCGISKEIVI